MEIPLVASTATIKDGLFYLLSISILIILRSLVVIIKIQIFPGIRHLLFWSFTRWQTPPPAVAVQRGGASSIIRQYSESWSNNCKLYNFRVLQCWQKCMLGNAFSKFTISIKLWHSKEIVLVGPFLLYCVNQKFKNSIVRIIFKTFKEW